MKKLAVYAPRTGQSILASYPFFHLLFDSFPGQEISVLVHNDIKKYFSFLDGPIFLHGYDTEYDSITGLYKYIYHNQRIKDIDCYIDLGETLKSSLVGLYLKAKERVGAKEGLKQFLYTHKIMRPIEKSSEKKYFKILESYMKKSQNDFFIEKDIGEPNFFQSPLVQNKLIAQEFSKGYFLVVINDIGMIDYLEEERKDTVKEHFWRSFFESFTGQRFVVFSDRLNNDLNDFLKSLTLRNEYFHQRGDNFETLAELFKYSNGLFTDSPSMASLGSYYLKPSFLMGLDTFELPLSLCLKGRPCVITKEGNEFYVFFSSTKKKFFSIVEVSEFIQDLLKL